MLANKIPHLQLQLVPRAADKVIIKILSSLSYFPSERYITESLRDTAKVAASCLRCAAHLRCISKWKIQVCARSTLHAVGANARRYFCICKPIDPCRQQLQTANWQLATTTINSSPTAAGSCAFMAAQWQHCGSTVGHSRATVGRSAELPH